MEQLKNDDSAVQDTSTEDLIASKDNKQEEDSFGKNDKKQSLGPWDSVGSKEIEIIVDRVAAENSCDKHPSEEKNPAYNKTLRQSSDKSRSKSSEQMERNATKSAKIRTIKMRPRKPDREVYYGYRTVSSAKLDDIVKRLTKPTIASRGGVDLRNKEFVYILPPKNKTNIQIPGLEKKFNGSKKLSNDERQQSVQRTNTLTSAYQAKYGPNRNGWRDTSYRLYAPVKS